MESCLNTLYGPQKSQHIKSTDTRKRVMKNLPYNDWVSQFPEHQLKINGLPESISGAFNKLEYQKCLDFLRTFDACLHMEEENEECDVLRTTLEMAKTFGPLLDTKLS
jgi:hypothetical protein